ncbi:hypothetical protein BaRGS_00003447, partial [Batillaria attramentaria]
DEQLETDVTMTTCDVQAYRSSLSALAMQHLMLTAAMVVLFVCTKAYVNQLRRQNASPHVERVVLYEEETRQTLVNRDHQIALDRKTVEFLKGLDVDFDNMEGCMEKSIFYTRIGIFLEHLLNMLPKMPVRQDLKLATKVVLRDMLCCHRFRTRVGAVNECWTWKMGVG